MSGIQTTIQHAERHCKDHGTRLTNKRKQVLAGLLQSEKALSAYELVDYCKSESGDTMPAMSVYRILDFLQSERLVHKLKLSNKYVACSHITCDHAHGIPQFLVCGECQRVKEITTSAEVIDTLKHEAVDAGYHLISPQIEMDCLCDSCFSSAH